MDEATTESATESDTAPDTGPDTGPAAETTAEAAVLAELNALGGLPKTMGIEIVEATAQRVVARMPVDGNTQPYGVLHGGASCVLAETVGSIGSALHAGPESIAMGVEINASHHRSVSTGFVTAVATQLYGGRTLASYEIVITDDRDRRVCTARLTCAVRGQS